MKSKEITEKGAGELYKVLNKYIGETMTEHVAFIFLSFMIFCNSISLLAIDHIVNRIGILGINTASGLFIGNLEFLGIKRYLLLIEFFHIKCFWLLLLGICII